MLEDKDIAALQIKQNEIIDIHYLQCDLNWTLCYSKYNDCDILTIGYPRMILSTGSGKIKGILILSFIITFLRIMVHRFTYCFISFIECYWNSSRKR